MTFGGRSVPDLPLGEGSDHQELPTSMAVGGGHRKLDVKNKMTKTRISSLKTRTVFLRHMTFAPLCWT